MQRIETSLKDVVVVEPKVFGDARGFFFEAYNEATFRSLGLPTDFKQDNQSGSRKGVLRGLHYQMKQPQGKLVRALHGEIFDVAVDLRRGSPQFGHSGPFGQCSFSKYFRAASSLWKIGSVRLIGVAMTGTPP